MASVTKSNKEKSAMADDELPDEIEPADEPREDKAPRPKSQDQGRPLEARREGGGYFTLYKRGQGYWTRVGTVIGAAIIGIFTAYNLYAYVPTFLPERVPPAVGTRIGLGVAVGFAVGFAWLCWHLLNKPTNADFLIATDSEMKKVNWTSRRELIGSTKVVIAFMFLTALFLFLCDNIFVFLMKQIGVLKFGYFGS
jgi:preprotein translocase subunit SecE